jgi:hypothetical protein
MIIAGGVTMNNGIIMSVPIAIFLVILIASLAYLFVTTYKLRKEVEGLKRKMSLDFILE